MGRLLTGGLTQTAVLGKQWILDFLYEWVDLILINFCLKIKVLPPRAFGPLNIVQNLSGLEKEPIARLRTQLFPESEEAAPFSSEKALSKASQYSKVTVKLTLHRAPTSRSLGGGTADKHNKRI